MKPSMNENDRLDAVDVPVDSGDGPVVSQRVV